MNDKTASETKTTKRTRPLWFRLLRALALAYVLIVVLMIFFERWLVFPAPKANSGDWNPPIDFKEVSVLGEGGSRLVGWCLVHQQPENYIMVFHGNGENVAHCGAFLERLRNEFNASVIAIDYQGYGKSGGNPSESNILPDSIKCFDFFVDFLEIEPSDVVVYGRSLGGSPATFVCQERNVRCLILDSTFDRLAYVAANRFPFLPVRLLMRNQFPSENWAGKVVCPVIQFHRLTDEIVPFEHGRRLFEVIGSTDKEFVEIDYGSHNSPPDPVFYAKSSEFLQNKR